MLRVLSLLLALIAALSLAQAPQSFQPPPANQPTIRISVNLVQVDAVVTDARDRQVTDLKAGDFEILQDGKSQVITNFSYVSIKPGDTRIVPVALPKGTLALPPPPSVATKIDQVRRTVALVVDDLGLSFDSIARLRSVLKKFVDERMEPGDLVAIVRTGAGMGALQQFTTDKRMLYAAIDRVRYNALGRVGVSPFAPIQPVESILAASDDDNPAPDPRAPLQGTPAAPDTTRSDEERLTFVDEPDDGHKAVFDVMVMTFGDNGQEESSGSTTYTMRLRAEAYHQALENGLLYTVNHPVKKAGAYQLRVALRDATSEKVGSASQFIEVPDVSKGRLLLSGIVLRAEVPPEPASVAGNRATAATPLPAEGVQTQEIDPKGTPAVRIFKPGKAMIYGYQVLNAKAGPGQHPQLEVQTRLFRDGQSIHTGQPQMVQMGDQTDPKHLMAGGRMQLAAKIATGDYVLQVVVTDKLAKRTATQSIDFSVE